MVSARLALLLVASLLSVSLASAGTPYGNELLQDEALVPGQSLSTALGCRLQYQGDGNLVLLFERGNYSKVVWGSSENGKAATSPNPGKAVMQGDGNFVLYNTDQKPYWSSKSSGRSNQGPFRLVLQFDCNLAIVDASQNALSVSKTNIVRSVIEMEEEYTSADYSWFNRGHYLTSEEAPECWVGLRESDGRFAIYQGDKELWAAPQYGQRMQLTDAGNFDMYGWRDFSTGSTRNQLPWQDDPTAPALVSIWDSNTAGRGVKPYKIILLPTCRMVLVDNDDHITWSQGTRS